MRQPGAFLYEITDGFCGLISGIIRSPYLAVSDEEFDAEEVIKIVKRLEELEPTEAPEKSVDEFLDDFWKYCEEREREEKILEEFRKQNSCIYDEKSVVL